jgi:hypothetical protein
VASNEVKRQVRAQGISERTLFRVKARMGVIAEREGSFTDRRAWVWRLPEAPNPAKPPQDCQFPPIGNVAEQGPVGSTGSPEPATLEPLL